MLIGHTSFAKVRSPDRERRASLGQAIAHVWVAGRPVRRRALHARPRVAHVQLHAAGGSSVAVDVAAVEVDAARYAGVVIAARGAGTRAVGVLGAGHAGVEGSRAGRSARVAQLAPGLCAAAVDVEGALDAADVVEAGGGQGAAALAIEEVAVVVVVAYGARAAVAAQRCA